MLSATCPSRGFTDPARARSRFWAFWADYGLTEVIPPSTQLRPDDAGDKSGSESWPTTLVQRFLLRTSLAPKNRIGPDKIYRLSEITSHKPISVQSAKRQQQSRRKSDFRTDQTERSNFPRLRTHFNRLPTGK